MPYWLAYPKTKAARSQPPESKDRPGSLKLAVISPNNGVESCWLSRDRYLARPVARVQCQHSHRSVDSHVDILAPTWRKAQ